MHRLNTQFHLAKLSLHKNTAVKLLNHGQREVCGEHKDCFSRCASCPARLQMKKPSQKLQKLRHGNKRNPFPWLRRQSWESGPATRWEQEATLPACTCPLLLQTPLAPALLPLHAGMNVLHVMWQRKVRPAFSEFPNRSLIQQLLFTGGIICRISP